MLYTMENERLRVTVNSLGAQLWSICTRDGVEVLWQGDEKYWADRAPTLFPYVARLWQGAYVLGGERYELPIHGFAPQSEFWCVSKSRSQIVLELMDSEETFAVYPRRFAFRVRYALEGSRLLVAYEVDNFDTRVMFFGIGGHPGFNVPLEKGLRFEDYRLRFGQPCAPLRVGFSADCFVNGEEDAFALEEGCLLPLRHDLFDDDAIVLKQMDSSVTLESPGGSRSVTVSYPDMPYLGIWHRPHTDAPYVCIEPWRSLPARQGEITVMELQRDLVQLAPGESYRNRWTIEVK